MAAELQPSEEPAAALPSAANAPSAATARAASHSDERPVEEKFAAPPPPPATKRQRRPSVRLGEIGEHQTSSLAHDSRARRPKWRLPKDQPNRKARSLTRLVNGNGDSDFDPSLGKPKPKRGIGIGAGFGIGTTTKRVRSGWTSKPEETSEHNLRDWEAEEEEEEEEGEEEEEEEEGDGGDRRGGGSVYRDFKRSPSPSGDDDGSGLESWQRRANQQAPESENREGRGDGVRRWLMELGLGRYSPIFEVHEVDEEVLPMLTLEDLKDMGISAVGSRRKMYTNILKLRRGFS